RVDLLRGGDNFGTFGGIFCIWNARADTGVAFDQDFVSGTRQLFDTHGQHRHAIFISLNLPRDTDDHSGFLDAAPNRPEADKYCVLSTRYGVQSGWNWDRAASIPLRLPHPTPNRTPLPPRPRLPSPPLRWPDPPRRPVHCACRRAAAFADTS